MTTSGALRRDIQGLRMVAVVAVVVSHLTGHPQGGFVGVDVFFVISGFLITATLLRDLEAGPGPAQYLRAFYVRRVRRLLPAAVFVIAATCAVAYGVFNSARVPATVRDGLWAAAFGANWHAIDVHTDYFAVDRPQSPFEHYWSLSVEEQFYVVWPLVLFVGVLLASGRTGTSARRHRGAATAAALLSAVSLAIAFEQARSTATLAYFSSLTRGWELGLGALLAALAPRLRLRPRVRVALSWSGTAVILGSLFLVGQASGIPAPGVIAPCLGTLLVLAASDGAAPSLLTHRAAVFVGTMSYSVYLVHLPVIVVLGAWMGGTSATYYVAAVAAIVGLSLAVYGLVERPVLDSSWLLPTPTAPRQRRRPTRSAVLGIVLALVGITVSLWNGRDEARAVKAVAVRAALAQHEPAAVTELGALHAQLRAALRATRWPTLVPSVDAEVAKEVPEPPEISACGQARLVLQHCTWGADAAQHTVLLVGDSTSVAYTDVFRTLIEAMPSWRLVAAGGVGCNFGDTVVVVRRTRQAAGCVARQRAVHAAIERLRPDVLVITNRASADKGYATVRESIEREVRSLAGTVGTVVVLPPPPSTLDPEFCYDEGGSPLDCVAEVQGKDSAWLAEQAVLARDLGGVLVRDQDWFCVADVCPGFAGHLLISQDGNHLTDAFAVRLVPIVRDRLAGVFAGTVASVTRR